MGIYDRDYLRDDEPGFHARMPQTMVVRLMIVTGFVYLAQIFQPAITEWFKLESDWFRTPWKAYQLLTTGFLHSPGDITHIIYNMFGLWFFGRDIEARYGSREFLGFYLVAIVVGSLLFTLGEIPFGSQFSALGASGAITAIIILYAFNFPHRQVLFMFIFPMPMWVLGCLLVGMDMVGAIQRTGIIACTAHLGGALFALLYYKLNWRLSTWMPWRFSLPKFRTGPKLRVHRPDEEDDMAAKVDAVLDKITREGQDSLTRAERKLLERASREYQHRRK